MALDVDNRTDEPGDDWVACSKTELRNSLFADRVASGAIERRRLTTIAGLAAAKVWLDDDCRDMTQWVALALGIGTFEARRLTDCALVIHRLPHIGRALETGVLSIRKVVELTRFATPETGLELVRWAKKVAPSTIKRRADEACARDRDEQRAVRNERYFRWNPYEDRVYLEGMLPLDTGLHLVDAVKKAADELTYLPDDELFEADETVRADQRRADALVALVLSDAKVTTEVIVHTRLDEQGFGNGTERSGVVLHPDLVEMLACECRLRFVLTDEEGNATGIGRASSTPPEWLKKVVFKRDNNTCRFPDCDCRLYLAAHHANHWGYGGPTDLENLLTLCPRHHALLHVHGWSVFIGSDGTDVWYRPDGSRYSGLAPPMPA